MALRPGPSRPCPLTYLIPHNLVVRLPPPPFPLLPSRTGRDAQLIIFFEASRLIDRTLWLEFIITFDLSAVSSRGRPDCSEDGERESGFALSGFHIVPDYRRPRNENPIIESQRFSFLPRYLCYCGEKKRQLAHYCYCVSRWLVSQCYDEWN